MRRSALLAATLLFASAAHATDVSGTITTATWTAENSPYHVTDTVLVAEGATLTIEPGVDVLFDADVPFFVHGVLSANGTESDSIRFLRGLSEWAGMQLLDTDSAGLSYVRLSDVGTESSAALGFRADTAHLEVRNSVFSDNAASDVISAKGIAVDALIDSCRFVRNRMALGHVVELDAQAATGKDEGDLVATIANTVFEQNGMPGAEGSVEVVLAWRCDLSIRDTRIVDNHALGVRAMFCEPMLLESCGIERNGGIGVLSWSGGVFNARRSVIAQNGSAEPAPGDPSGMARELHLYADAALLENVTIAGRAADSGVELADIHFANGRISARGSILHGRTTISDTHLASGDLALGVDHSLVRHDLLATSGTGNINADPLFVDPENGDYRLQAASPCIDAGDPDSPLDPDGTRADMGAFPFDGTGTSRLAFEPAESYPGGSFVLAVRGTFADARGIDLAFVVDATILTPSDPFMVWSEAVPSPQTNVIDDTVFVALANANSFSLAGDTLIVFARFDVAIDAPADTSLAVRWVASPATVVDEHEAILVDGVVRIGEEPVAVLDARPSAFVLEQNAPNPFNPSTTISFAIPEAGHVRLDVYNVAGQHIATLRETTMPTGRHTVVWNGTDRAGRVVASGVYVYRLVWTGELRSNSSTNRREATVRRAVFLR